MKIIHRVTIHPDEYDRTALLAMGLQLLETNNAYVRLITFEVEESHPSWPKIKELIVEWQAPDFIRTVFSKCEFEVATHYVMFALGRGYPQPEGDFGFLRETYDLSDYCQVCGNGKKQIAPFRIKGEPKWGKKKHIFELNWVPGEFFVAPHIWETIFQPLGISYIDVLDHRTGKALQNVFQLSTKDIAVSPLAIYNYPAEVCAKCGRKKYLPVSRGFFPSFETVSSSHLFKTQEVFGSGAEAWNAPIVSRELYKAIQSQKLSGVEFLPLHNRNTV